MNHHRHRYRLGQTPIRTNRRRELREKPPKRRPARKNLRSPSSLISSPPQSLQSPPLGRCSST
ncbi:unnamed protein product [Linum tenue]|uniref:Uncharacterized protein n=1 Tax=Linum tenue TaxID=586396 RepID=A0AAV0LIY0_9ROSI|nr:unnamed protein product [Linum tenue]